MNFRVVRQASLEFGQGLNVLFGPNDIGKSSLVDAIRAAFLLPFGAAVARQLVPWGTDLVPQVTVEFQVQGAIWRVNKTFGVGPRGTAQLDRDGGGGTWREEAKAKAVDLKLRELLAWGIPAPGEKGAPKGLPESYLTTALLGRQESVPAILTASIEEDTVDSGLMRITTALGVLGQDPRVSSLLDRLRELVELAFMANGRSRPAGPLGKMASKLLEQDSKVRQLEAEIGKSAEVERKSQHLIGQRIIAAEDSARIGRRLGLLRALNAAEIEVSRILANQKMIENARHDLKAAEENVKAIEKKLQQATAEQRRLDDELRTARERLAKAMGRCGQVRENAEQAREVHRARLIGQRDTERRSMQSAIEVNEAGKQVNYRQSEFNQAVADCESARQELVRAEKVVVLAGALAERQAAMVIIDAHNITKQEHEERAATAAMAGKEHERAEIMLAEAERNYVSVRDGLARAEREAAARQLEGETLRASLIRAEAAEREALQTVGQVKRAFACDERLAEAEKTLTDLSSQEREITTNIAVNVEHKDSCASIARLLFVLVLAILGCGVTSVGLEMWLKVHVLVIIATGILLGSVAVASAIALLLRKQAMAALDREREELRDKRTQIGATRGLAEMRVQSARSERDQSWELLGARDASVAANLRLQETRVELKRINDGIVALNGQLPANLMASAKQVRDLEQRIETLKPNIQEKKRIHDAAIQDQARAQARLDEKSASLTGIDLAELERRVDGARMALETACFAPDLNAAQTAVDHAKQLAAECDTAMKISRGRVADSQVRFKDLTAALGQPADAVLSGAEQTIAAVESALAELDSTPLPELTVAENELQESQSQVALLEKQILPVHAQVDGAIHERDEARTFVAQAATKLEGLVQSFPGTDIAIAENALREARKSLDEDFAKASDLPMDLVQAEALFQRQTEDLHRIEKAVVASRAQLELVGGAVLKDQLDREREEHERLKASADDLELELNGTKRLFEVLKESATKHTAHLGKSLGKLVTEKFLELTAGRYGQVAFDPGLRIEHIAADYGEREATTLSVGTRDQLATLIRLALGAHLKTVVLLDDQLTQADWIRLGWFRDRLRASVREHGHQIIVVTCRPMDYLRPGEMRDSDKWETEDCVMVTDLQRAISTPSDSSL
jgi:hypothetical protein